MTLTRPASALTAPRLRETPNVFCMKWFMRLYTLRNQLMHGGATWNSSVNRAQVRDGRSLLARMIPVMLGVMMSNPVSFQGHLFYPVVADS